MWITVRFVGFAELSLSLPRMKMGNMSMPAMRLPRFMAGSCALVPRGLPPVR